MLDSLVRLVDRAASSTDAAAAVATLYNFCQQGLFAFAEAGKVEGSAEALLRFVGMVSRAAVDALGEGDAAVAKNGSVGKFLLPLAQRLTFVPVGLSFRLYSHIVMALYSYGLLSYADVRAGRPVVQADVDV